MEHTVHILHQRRVEFTHIHLLKIIQQLEHTGHVRRLGRVQILDTEDFLHVLKIMEEPVERQGHTRVRQNLDILEAIPPVSLLARVPVVDIDHSLGTDGYAIVHFERVAIRRRSSEPSIGRVGVIVRNGELGDAHLAFVAITFDAEIHLLAVSCKRIIVPESLGVLDGVAAVREDSIVGGGEVEGYEEKTSGTLVLNLHGHHGVVFLIQTPLGVAVGERTVVIALAVRIDGNTDVLVLVVGVVTPKNSLLLVTVDTAFLRGLRQRNAFTEHTAGHHQRSKEK